MTRFFRNPIRPSTAYTLIAVVWLLTRAYSFTQTVPWQFWEIWEARKLLDYGFLARQGGIIEWHFMTGMLDSPEKFNYVNHPYPILWIFTLFYHFLGEWGALLFGSALGLLSTLAVYPALKVRFSSGESLFGTLLFAVAPTGIIMSANPNIVALGSVGWPFVVLCLAKFDEGPSFRHSCLLAGIVFLIGQISWFTYTISAAIVFASLLQMFLSKNLKRSWRTSPIIPIVVGSLATLAVFIIQILYYTYDFSEVLRYAHGQAGAEAGISFSQLYRGIFIRIVLSVGPGLLVGGVLGLGMMLKGIPKHWLEWVAIVYILIFLGTSLLLPRFFFRELSMYEYLIFPLTLGTLHAIESIRRGYFKWAIAGVAILSLVYPLFQASIPVVSAKSRAVSAAINRNTDKGEIVATNMASQKFPFESWDVGSANNTAMLADRLLRWEIRRKEALITIPTTLKVDECNITYVYCDEIPLDSGLREILSAGKFVKQVHVDLPIEPVSSAARIRNFYWKIVGKHQVNQKNFEAGSKGIDLGFYKVTLTH